MRGHNLCFTEEILKIIPKLSLLLLLIWSPVWCMLKAAKGKGGGQPLICCSQDKPLSHNVRKRIELRNPCDICILHITYGEK